MVENYVGQKREITRESDSEEYEEDQQGEGEGEGEAEGERDKGGEPKVPDAQSLRARRSYTQTEPQVISV